jgi:hypothetical protein
MASIYVEPACGWLVHAGGEQPARWPSAQSPRAVTLKAMQANAAAMQQSR